MPQSTGYEHLAQSAGGAQSFAPNMTSEDIINVSGAGASSSSIDNAGGDAVPRDLLAIEMNTARSVPIPDDVAMSPSKASS